MAKKTLCENIFLAAESTMDLKTESPPFKWFLRTCCTILSRQFIMNFECQA